MRSWRHRAQRKTVDRRARDDDAGLNAEDRTGGVPDELVDVMLPSDEWDASAGCAVKVPARARVVPFGQFEVGGEFASQGSRRELRISPELAARLKVGDVVLLGGEHVKQFSDALWRVVPAVESQPTAGAPFEASPPAARPGGRVTVEPARAPKPGPPAPPGGHEKYERERMKNWAAQEDEILRQMRERQALAEAQARR